MPGPPSFAAAQDAGPTYWRGRREEAREIVPLTDSYIDYSAFDANSDGSVTADEAIGYIAVAGGASGIFLDNQGEVRSYENAIGNFASFGDTTAFSGDSP